MTRLTLAAAWVGVQLLFFIGWTYREQVRVASGSSILVKVVPVDPRDLMRGQYLRLGYEFSRPWDSTIQQINVPDDSEIWVVLRPEGELYVPQALSLERPAALASGEVAIEGRANGRQFVFGVEQYFVPEGTETPVMSDLTVRLRVGRTGVVRIEQVYLKGAPWP